MQHFCYRNFHISKNQPLGHGSYGAVYKAKCDQLPCAAKVIHPTILDPNDPGAGKIMQRFQQECAFLENIRHPNIVQFLGMTRDPESRQPVLLMELLDENLTKMLECSQRSLAFSIQVDICHDIALAVAYLHSNDIIHRDLSSNNVLIMAKSRAKITDFGMSKLVSAAPSMTPLTACPGTQAYMPPEALCEQPTYTKKLDCFSEGVIMIQVCTRLWPVPGLRTITVQDSRSPTGFTLMPVPEPERRKNHIAMISSGHGLLPIAMDCLHYQENERPSSEELCQRLASLKETRKYRESTEQVERKKSDMAQIETKADGTWRWRKEEKSLHKMARGATFTDGNVIYFMNWDGQTCTYDLSTQVWSQLPECPYRYSGLAIINGLLTAIGGRKVDTTNKMFSIININDKEWVEQFPSMPTKRSHTAAISTKQHVIVAGGFSEVNKLDTVEVMDIQNLVWSTAASLSHPYYRASATLLCGDHLYMLGGSDTDGNRSTSVLTCSLTKLLQSCSETSDSVWHRITDVPVYHSTCAAVNGELVAIGGWEAEDTKSTAAVYQYNPITDSWNIISIMPTARYDTLVAVLPTNEVMVVGGYTGPKLTLNDIVEIACIMYT